MSLDVYLYSKEPVTRTCECCGQEFSQQEELFEANITHNLNKMADAAGIYMQVWRPDEIGVIRAGEIISALTMGIADMENRPEFYKQFDAPNGWGKYEDFVPWLKTYLSACIQYPDAEIRVSR